MDKRLLAVAVAGAMMAPAFMGNSVEIVRRDPAPDFGWKGGRGYGGRLRSRSTRMRRIDAFKAQRHANRQRRKALNK